MICVSKEITTVNNSKLREQTLHLTNACFHESILSYIYLSTYNSCIFVKMILLLYFTLSKVSNHSKRKNCPKLLFPSFSFRATLHFGLVN